MPKATPWREEPKQSSPLGFLDCRGRFAPRKDGDMIGFFFLLSF